MMTRNAPEVVTATSSIGNIHQELSRKDFEPRCLKDILNTDAKENVLEVEGDKNLQKEIPPQSDVL